MYEQLAILAVFAFLFSIIAGRVERSVMEHGVVCTITLCILAHGLTANLWAKRMANNEVQ